MLCLSICTSECIDLSACIFKYMLVLGAQTVTAKFEGGKKPFKN